MRSSVLELGGGSRGLLTGVRRTVGAAVVGFVVAAVLSADFDVANHAAGNQCAGATSVCIPLGYFVGGFVAAAIIVAVLVPLGLWLAGLRRGYLPAGLLLPFVVEQLSGVSLDGTLHPLGRYLAGAAIAFGLLGLIAHALESGRGDTGG